MVDDDTDIRESLKEVLEIEGYSVDVARDGQEALEKLRSSEHPDLVLLDWKMPRLNGQDFLEAVDADGALHGLTVLVVSAHLEQRPPARAAGFLRKPLSIEALLEAVQTHA